MANSGIGTAGGENIKIYHDDSVNSIRVQVYFSGSKKEELDVSGKILEIKGMKVSMTRFGSWVFQTVDLQTEEALKVLVELGEPTIAFSWALHRIYPENQISAWLDDASNCTFTLECENQQKPQILKEIGDGIMKKKVNEVLSEMNNLNLTIKLIKIQPAKAGVSAGDQPSVPKNNISSSETKSKKQCSKPNQQSVSEEQTAESSWDYKKLKVELDAITDKKKRLKKLMEFAVCSLKVGKLSQNSQVVDEMKHLMKEVQASQEEIQKILQSVRNFSQMLHDDEKPLESIDILLSSSNLVKNIKNAEERIEAVNLDLKEVCEVITEIYKIESNCIKVTVNIDDELRRSKPDHGSGTTFDRAYKVQKKGKRAFENYQYVKALNCYEKAINHQPKEMLYRLDKAEVFLAQGKYEECTKSCTEGLRLVTPDTSLKNQARIYDLLGEAEVRSCHPLKALNHFKMSCMKMQNYVTEGKFKLLEEEFLQAFDRIQAGRMPQLPLPNIPALADLPHE